MVCYANHGGRLIRDAVRDACGQMPTADDWHASRGTASDAVVYDKTRITAFPHGDLLVRACAEDMYRDIYPDLTLADGTVVPDPRVDPAVDALTEKIMTSPEVVTVGQVHAMRTIAARALARGSHKTRTVDSPHDPRPVAPRILDLTPMIEATATVADRADRAAPPTGTGADVTTVDDTSRIAGNATVSNTILSRESTVTGHARVDGSTVEIHATIDGYSRVAGSAVIGGRVGGHAFVRDAIVARSRVSGSATVDGQVDDAALRQAMIRSGRDHQAHLSNPLLDRSEVADRARVTGNASVIGSRITGDAGVGWLAAVTDSTVGGRAIVDGQTTVARATLGGTVHVTGHAAVSGVRLSEGRIAGNADVSAPDHVEVWHDDEIEYTRYRTATRGVLGRRVWGMSMRSPDGLGGWVAADWADEADAPPTRSRRTAA